MTIIVDRNNFQLDVTLSRQAGDRFSLELKQHHTQAQRPHWRRIAQLNLHRHELIALQEALNDQ